MGTKAKEAARADEPAIDAAAAVRIAEHYHRAKAKNPREHAKCFLTRSGKKAKIGINIAVSFFRFNAPPKVAVAYLYDAIAVLLRMIDVIEGRQKLGKTGAASAKVEKKEEAK